MFANVTDILSVIKSLREKNVYFEIEHTLHESLTMLIFLPDHWLEVEFRDDGIEYGVFRGEASGEGDLQPLMPLLEKYADMNIVMPAEILKKTVGEVRSLAGSGDARARTCIKLLARDRYRK